VGKGPVLRHRPFSSHEAYTSDWISASETSNKWQADFMVRYSAMSTGNAPKLAPLGPLERAKLLQAERTIEMHHVHNREQWFWVSFTTCLAGSVVALTSSSSPAIFVGVPAVMFFLNLYLSWIFNLSIQTSLEALTERHNTFVNFVDQTPCLHDLSFGFRNPRKETGLEGKVTIVDDVHLKGCRYTVRTTIVAPIFTFALFAVGLARHYYKM
jgi:hypothetical protein